ncbi:MAG: nicotinamide-nucleotide amidohydrolase family protein [Clostridia bacterium]|nr:nicotinamide-nucleotide amidohydrolase family protein [Clostridia bacterium]
MKTALVYFKRVHDALDSEYYANVDTVLKNGGVNTDTVIILSCADDIGFKRNLLELKDTVDNLIIVGPEKSEFDFKELVAESFDTVLVENENAKAFIDAVKTVNDGDDASVYALMPIEATAVPNISGLCQGFIFNQDQFTLVVLPSEFSELKPMLEKYVLPYLESKYGTKSRRLTFKYFGDFNRLKTTLENVRRERGDKFIINVREKYGDYTVDLLFKNQDEQLSKDVIREVVSQLKDDIYAEFETSLSERLFDLLKLKNLKVSVAESFTGGRIVSSIIANSGASSYVQEGVVSYSNQSKIKRLGVSETDLRKEGAVSSIVAYQMALGLLKTGDCDVAISTTGIAGPKSDNTSKPVGLCYIAVGMKDGVHTYRYNLTGTREEITETAKNTALFLAIKKLKNL